MPEASSRGTQHLGPFHRQGENLGGGIGQEGWFLPSSQPGSGVNSLKRAGAERWGRIPAGPRGGRGAQTLLGLLNLSPQPVLAGRQCALLG